MGKVLTALGTLVVIVALGVVIYVMTRHAGQPQEARQPGTKLAASQAPGTKEAPEKSPATTARETAPAEIPGLSPKTSAPGAEKEPATAEKPQEPPPLPPTVSEVPETREPKPHVAATTETEEARAETAAEVLPEAPKPIEEEIKGEPQTEKAQPSAVSRAEPGAETTPGGKQGAVSAAEQPSPSEEPPEKTPAEAKIAVSESETPADIVPAVGGPTEGSKPTFSTYVVKKDDTLWSIAVEVLGDGRRWKELLALNPGLPADGGGLKPGQVIKIPTSQPQEEEPQEEAPKPTWPYTVKAGDSLAAIAKRFYGTEAVWLEILAANPGLDPDALPVGETIQLPEINGKRPKGIAK